MDTVHLAVEDLAERWRVTPQSIYSLRNRSPESLPPAIKIGKFLRWRLADVEAFEEAQLPTSNVTSLSSRRSA